jgi:two-component system, OmpR family, response regulator
MTGPVLLVDDDPQIRLLVKSLLWEQGLSTIEAADGESALAALHEADGKIALVLTDVYMGKMNGIELARAVSAAYPAIPILFMSSAAAVEMLPCEVPTSAFILKPFSAALLTATVHGLLAAQG